MHAKQNRWKSSMLFAILGIWGAVLVLAPAPAAGQGGLNTSSDDRARDGGAVQVYLLADFSDFGCQVCLDDFLAFCDSLNVRTVSAEVQVRLIARRDSSRGEEAQRRFLAGWAKGNGYGFPVEVDSAGVFERRGVVKSSILVERADGEVIARGSFPLGRRRRWEILALLGGRNQYSK
jgi:hypothetical protein